MDKLENNSISDNLWQGKNHSWKVLYTSAFTNAFFRRKEKLSKPINRNKKRTANTYVIFQVSVPKLAPEHKVCLTGSRKELGGWDRTAFIPMNYIGNTIWEKEIKLDKTDDILHFKYGIYDSNRKEIITLEHGEDRFIYDINYLILNYSLIYPYSTLLYIFLIICLYIK